MDITPSATMTPTANTGARIAAVIRVLPSVVFQYFRHFHPAAFARRQDSRPHHGERHRGIVAAHLGLAIAANGRGELVELLDERVVLGDRHRDWFAPAALE